MCISNYREYNVKAERERERTKVVVKSEALGHRLQGRKFKFRLEYGCLWILISNVLAKS